MSYERKGCKDTKIHNTYYVHLFLLGSDLVVESVVLDPGFVVIERVLLLQNGIPHPGVVHILVGVSNWRIKIVEL